jgi:hypothetical protein
MDLLFAGRATRFLGGVLRGAWVSHGATVRQERPPSQRGSMALVQNAAPGPDFRASPKHPAFGYQALIPAL